MSDNQSRWVRPAVHAAHDAFRREMTAALTHAAHILEYDRLSLPDKMIEAHRQALSAIGRAEEALTRMPLTGRPA